MLTVLLSATMAPHEMTAWSSFVDIISKPDNMPVAGALISVIWVTWLAMKQARANDKLIAEGRKDEILSEMQKP